MVAASDFTTELEAKVAQQIKSQRVGYPPGAGSSDLDVDVIVKRWHSQERCTVHQHGSTPSPVPPIRCSVIKWSLL